MKRLGKKATFILAVLMILSIGVSSMAFADSAENSAITAKVSSSSVLVNGEKVGFESYNINDNNYFKLRDLAKIVSGTEKQFDVKWNNDKSAIELVSNAPYTEVGGELVAGDGVEKTAVLNTSTIFKDGEEIELVAYTINNNNYFKLRDIAQAFDIGVTWDGETSTVGIDTSIGYETTEEVITEPTETEETEETTEIEEISEPTEETPESEVSITASFVSPVQILVKFDKPLPASMAGETYASLVYLDYDGLSPWEIGLNPILVEGESEYLIELLTEERYEFELPGAGTYELNFGDFGMITLEVSEDLLK
ncbi:stalk domain-containing protein [Tissierella sp. Yu-01]|uniref:stalk domain-containing protein n=1 Tax=Tissierella sp. Yu-01 TaxID=3035694 RepID=UPI00240DAAAD|nr:stalk domain-containing protein [Tissierella sp. Yu-01]WFA08924.1 stalk domain-containing protein [Tissierella sp. Yu-01]